MTDDFSVGFVLLTFVFTEGGVTDLNDSIDYVAATDSNSDYNAAFDTASISTSAKV